MRCGSCGIELEIGSAFCGECGTAVPAETAAAEGACSSCGTINEPGSAFCGECGNAFTSEEPPTCSSCGQLNEVGASFCEQCGAELPQGSGPLGTAAKIVGTSAGLGAAGMGALASSGEGAGASTEPVEVPDPVSGEGTAQPGGEAAPQPGGEAAPQPGGEAAPQPGGEAAPQPGGEAAPQPGGEAAPQPGGEATPQPGGEAAPQPGGEAAPQPGGEAAPQSGGGQAAPQPGATSQPGGTIGAQPPPPVIQPPPVQPIPQGAPPLPASGARPGGLPGGPPLPPVSAAPGWTLATLIKWIILAVLGVFGAILGALVIAAILLVTGSPQPCVDRQNAYAAGASADLRARWELFKDQTADGPANIVMSELEVTSRGIEYIDEKDLPVKDLQVYFCPDGHAEAVGRIEILGLDSNVVVEGTLDLSGERPQIRVTRVRAGNLPSAVGTRAVNLVLDQGDARTLQLGPKITSIGYADTVAVMEGEER